MRLVLLERHVAQLVEQPFEGLARLVASAAIDNQVVAQQRDR